MGGVGSIGEAGVKQNAALQEGLERFKAEESIPPAWVQPETTPPVRSWLCKVVQRRCGGD